MKLIKSSATVQNSKQTANIKKENTGTVSAIINSHQLFSTTLSSSPNSHTVFNEVFQTHYKNKRGVFRKKLKSIMCINVKMKSLFCLPSSNISEVYSLCTYGFYPYRGGQKNGWPSERQLSDWAFNNISYTRACLCVNVCA